MGTIIMTIILFLCGMFIGLSVGVRTITEHLIKNNRLTDNEAKYYYSISNLVKIWKNNE